jgi:hypothetical protein
MALVHLRTSNGHYLCAEGGGGGAVDATRTAAAQWETFDLQLVFAPFVGPLGTLRAANNDYVCAEGGGNGPIVANRPSAAAWETFRIEGLTGTTAHLFGGEQIHLKAADGLYVCAEGGGGAAVDATRPAAAQWETFTVELATPPSTATHFTVAFESFQITNTRSRHTDTDFASLGLGAASTSNQVQTKAMGDLNNGTYQVGLAEGPVDASQGSQGLVFHYSVVNQGHTDASTVETQLHNAVNALLDIAKKALDGQVNQQVPTSGSGQGMSTADLENEALKQLIAVAAWILAQAVNAGITAFFADCDGVCVADTIALDLATLQRLTGSGTYRETRAYPGANSPSGCGTNSMYYATFSVTPH